MTRNMPLAQDRPSTQDNIEDASAEATAPVDPVAGPPTALGPRDYASEQEVRWCLGCGNYAIIKAVQKTLAEARVDPDNTVFVSGIGCSSRFPYYMDTYGFHTIHGRAAAVATGVKLANPALDVWVVSGDGDSLAIGGNHLLHLLRRNVHLTYLLLNNEIYGLTKGQASPTSREGTVSPTSPLGTHDRPVDAMRFALGAGGRFVARVVDTGQDLMKETLDRAHRFRGTGFVEILQNCLVFNDGVFADVQDKKTQADRQLRLVHGEPMLFGRSRDRGIRLDPATLTLEAVTLGQGLSEADLLVHDETNPRLAWLLADMSGPDLPLPVGVLFADSEPVFSERLDPVEEDSAKGLDALQAALDSGPSWTVGG